MVAKDFTLEVSIGAHRAHQQARSLRVRKLDSDGFFVEELVAEVWPPTELHVVLHAALACVRDGRLVA